MRNMPATDVIALLTRFNEDGIHVWIDGGWAVDALLGYQTRPHGDLDIVVEEKDVSRIRHLLNNCGYIDKVDDDTRAWNFVMNDRAGREVDVHVIVFDSNRNGIYGPSKLGLTYPADSLTGRGLIDGYPVSCISPEWLVQFHTGYEIDDHDVQDVMALHERFGVQLPDEYLAYNNHPVSSKARENRIRSQFSLFKLTNETVRSLSRGEDYCCCGHSDHLKIDCRNPPHCC